jgi:hypothetical protein
VGIVLLVTLVSAGLFAIDTFAPRGRIVSGWQIWRCDAPRHINADEAGLTAGEAFDGFGAVASGDRWEVLAARVRDAEGRSLGTGVWKTTSDKFKALPPREGLPPDEFGALDVFARQHASRHSTLPPDTDKRKAAAARECLQKGLPDYGKTDLGPPTLR